MAHAIARAVLVFVFLYHGIVPKLLVRHPDEVAMLAAAGVPAARIHLALALLGLVEVAWAVLLLAWWRARWPLAATALAMPVLVIVVGLRSPEFLIGAFTPVTLNAAVGALAVLGWLASREMPSASRCLREPPLEGP